MKRRAFIQNSAMAVAGSLLIPSLMQCTTDKKKSIGLQLYTLRHKLKKEGDATGYFSREEIKTVLETIAKTGYEKLECYSYKNQTAFDIPYKEFNTMVNDLGMKIVSGHYSSGFNSQDSGNLRNNWEQAVSDAKEIGQSYMVVPYLEKDERATIDDYKKLCELLNKGGEVCKQHGIRLGYHNHEFEFQKIEDQVPYDVMLAELDPSLVMMELDLYWVVRGGFTPLEYFTKYPGRFELWHVKDMNKTDEKQTTSPGQGSIDFQEIFKHAAHAGMKDYFVEIENYEVSEYDSIKKGFDYLNSL